MKAFMLAKPWLRFFILIAALPSAFGTAHAEDKFRRQSSKEIRKTVAVRQITDGFHWADHFFADGQDKYVTMGRVKHGPCTLENDKPCTISRARKSQDIECVEIWRSGDTVQYRTADGYMIAEGSLKPLNRSQ